MRAQVWGLPDHDSGTSTADFDSIIVCSGFAAGDAVAGTNTAMEGQFVRVERYRVYGSTP